MGLRVLLLAAAVAAAAGAGCGNASLGAVDAGSDAGTTPANGPQICPTVVYTGFVPASTAQPMGLKYSVPILLLRGQGVSWVTDNNLVALASGDDMGGTIYAVGEGSANVSAVNRDGGRYSIAVKVKMYPADSNLKGNDLYEMHIPNCTNCHDSPGQSNVTSAGVSDKTDQEVIDAFTLGKKAMSEGGGMLNVPGGHMFSDLAGDKQIQMVSFLRSNHTKRPPGMDTCR